MQRTQRVCMQLEALLGSAIIIIITLKGGLSSLPESHRDPSLPWPKARAVPRVLRPLVDGSGQVNELARS